jgi:transcriptional regulator CtsR
MPARGVGGKTMIVRLKFWKGEEMTAKPVEKLQENIEKLKAAQAQPAGLDAVLHEKIVSEKQIIMEATARIEEYRRMKNWIEDTPNAEVMLQSLARFLPLQS